ncbi:MAG: DUF2191 domain-containing protein [Acidimicrobiales bacterium]
MTKRLIELDDNKLEMVRQALGTGTIKATVDGAFEEVLALIARREALLTERALANGELADPPPRQAAWG